MPVGLDNVDAAGAFVGFGMFDPVHVTASRWMVARKCDKEDLGTVLWSVKCLHMSVPIDGLKCIERPGVPGHESLARSGDASCLSLVGVVLHVVKQWSRH
jgi:hypothetical protein